MRSLSNPARIAAFAQTTPQTFLILIEITHADLATPIRLVNNTQAIVSGAETYHPMAFELTPPVEEDGQIRASTITFDAVDRSLIEAVRSIDDAPHLSAAVILASTPNVIEAGPWEFVMRGVNYNAQSVSAELLPDNPMDYVISAIAYRQRDFPGVYDV